MAKRGNKKEDILQATLALILRYGISKVTVNDICQEANVSKMTFYKYFEDKVSAIEATMVLKCEDWKQKYTDIINRCTTANEFFVEYIKMEQKDNEAMSPDYYNDLVNNKDTSHILAILAEKLLELQIKYLNELIEKAKQKKFVRADLNNLLLLKIMSTINKMFSTDKELAEHYQYDPRKLADEVLKIIFFGIAYNENHEK